MSADPFAAQLAEAVRAVLHDNGCASMLHWLGTAHREDSFYVAPRNCPRDARIGAGNAAALEVARTGTVIGTWAALQDAALAATLQRLRNGGTPSHLGSKVAAVVSWAPGKPAPRPAITPLRQRASGATDPPDVSRSQQRILNGLAWLESVGVPSADKGQVALLADQSPTSSGYTNNLGALRSAGLVHYPRPGVAALTDEGRAAAEPVDVPVTSAQLHAQLFAKLARAQVRILEVLIAAYPREVAKEELAEQSEQSATSSGYTNNLGRLRSLGLIEYPGPGRVVALPVLFLER